MAGCGCGIGKTLCRWRLDGAVLRGCAPEWEVYRNHFCGRSATRSTLWQKFVWRVGRWDSEEISRSYWYKFSRGPEGISFRAAFFWVSDGCGKGEVWVMAGFGIGFGKMVCRWESCGVILKCCAPEWEVHLNHFCGRSATRSTLWQEFVWRFSRWDSERISRLYWYKFSRDPEWISFRAAVFWVPDRYGKGEVWVVVGYGIGFGKAIRRWRSDGAVLRGCTPKGKVHRNHFCGRSATRSTLWQNSVWRFGGWASGKISRLYWCKFSRGPGGGFHPDRSFWVSDGCGKGRGWVMAGCEVGFEKIGPPGQSKMG